jgi:sugar/nucleoside kinase (ribokinase family)
LSHVQLIDQPLPSVPVRTWIEEISTGAGDHFNAGFSMGQVLGFNLEESLCCGVGTSGYYVRNGASPTGTQLSEVMEKLPPPQ